MGSVQTVKIKAEFLLILRWTIVFALGILGFLFLAAWFGRRNASVPPMTSSEMILLARQVAGWGILGVAGFAGLLYAITRFTVVRITSDEISGRSYWGFRVRFPAGSVTDVMQTRYQGVRYLWISSSESSRQLCLVLLGIRFEKYVDDLSRLLGAEHKLTQWFSSRARVGSGVRE